MKQFQIKQKQKLLENYYYQYYWNKGFNKKLSDH